MVPLRRVSSPFRGIQPYRFSHTALALLGCVTILASKVSAHPPERPVNRELVRIQGYHAAPPSGTAVSRELVLVAQGKEYPFWATAWRRLKFEPETAKPTPPERDRITLQADFPVLARFVNARPDQLITILGDRRPGSADLFVLELDLCPPH